MSTQHTPTPSDTIDALGSVIYNARELTDAQAAYGIKVIQLHDELLAALRDAYAHVTLLASGQKPADSNAEMCERLGAAIAKAQSK